MGDDSQTALRTCHFDLCIKPSNPLPTFHSTLCLTIPGPTECAKRLNSPGQRPIGVWKHLDAIHISRFLVPFVSLFWDPPAPNRDLSRDTHSQIFGFLALEASIFLDFGQSFFGPRFFNGFLHRFGMDFDSILASFFNPPHPAGVASVSDYDKSASTSCF